MHVLAQSDCLIVGGTSLLVNTATSLLPYFTGKNFIIINLDKTPYDSYANILIHEKLSKVLKKIK